MAFRLPLGAFWLGECRAPKHAGFVPDDETQLDCCNFGYVRGKCPRFPAEADCDAARFVRRGDAVLFILEKAHVPERFGPVSTIEPDSVLEKQAQAWNWT